MAEHIEKTINFADYLSENLNNSIEYSKYLSEKLDENFAHNDYLAEQLQKNCDHNDYLAEKLETTGNYANYVAEQLENTGKYADYLAENLEKNFAHNDYLAENLNNGFKYNEYLAEQLQLVADGQSVINESKTVETPVMETINENKTVETPVVEAKQVKSNDEYKSSITEKLDALLNAPVVTVKEDNFLNFLSEGRKNEFNSLDEPTKQMITEAMNAAAVKNEAQANIVFHLFAFITFKSLHRMGVNVVLFFNRGCNVQKYQFYSLCESNSLRNGFSHNGQRLHME